MTKIRKGIGLFLVLPGILVAQRGAGADFNVVNNGISDYRINGVNDPTLTLIRGQTYSFAIAATGHPFWIKTNAVTGTTAAYNSGVTGNGIDNGTLTFSVPLNAPNSLAYICQIHAAMQGALVITNPPPAPALLSSPRVSAPGQLSFDVQGVSGRLHVIEAKTNLAVSGAWIPIGSNTPPDGSFTFTDTNTGASDKRSYRVRTQ
ncbi:MAG TPA: hypothetical protein P5205_01955 [Candidatus Paceibacterota bacterium]|nr:hypothetical protein [Verrucomicrobiota bacterium]HSA09110.1 hypothetical protein [Candidatus Paceibacterota bacterium]